MGRGKSKGKKFSLTNNNDDPASGDDEKIPSQKRRGRPQKQLMEEVEEDVDRIEEEEEDDDDDGSANSYVNGKRKRNKEDKEKGKSIKVERPNGTRANGFRHVGSRRKNKPHRAAEVGVECK